MTWNILKQLLHHMRYLCLIASIIASSLNARIIPISCSDPSITGTIELFDRQKSIGFFNNAINLTTPFDFLLFNTLNKHDLANFTMLHEQYMPVKVKICNQSNRIIYLEKNSYLHPIQRLQKAPYKLSNLYRRLQKKTTGQASKICASCILFTTLLGKCYKDTFEHKSPGMNNNNCPYNTTLPQKIWGALAGVTALLYGYFAYKVIASTRLSHTKKKIKTLSPSTNNETHKITKKMNDPYYYTIHPSWTFTEIIFLDLSKILRSESYTLQPKLIFTVAQPLAEIEATKPTLTQIIDLNT